MKCCVLLLGALGSALAAPGIALAHDVPHVARAVPGFGGMYIDDNGDLNVYMVAADAGAGQMHRTDLRFATH